MNKYLVNWNYEAGWREGRIVLFAGDIVELEEATAEHINFDSPGCLTPVPEVAALDADTRQEVAPPSDRMVKGAANRQPRPRKDRQAHANEGVMTTDDFKAVKEKDE